MDRDYFDEAREPRLTRLRALALPVAVLIVVAAVICGLVLGGVLQGDKVRVRPGNAPTTVPTIELNL
ncbi:MAG: hypothetical protein M1274_06400 [Actinobacteria bacterium]|nr:hypothetical protein [Actinomycetota bacterium]